MVLSGIINMKTYMNRMNVIAQQFKQLITIAEPDLPFQDQATLLPLQLPAKVPGKVADDNPCTWIPDTHVGSSQTLAFGLAQS